MSTTPGYVTNHGAACSEIVTLASLLVETITEIRTLPGRPNPRLAFIAARACELESVQRALAP
ncbi:MAG: hypothetical protein ACRDTT_11945 [Pseudonocardiaceae bacterium]